MNGQPMFASILEKVVAVQDKGLIKHIIVVAQHQEIIELAEEKFTIPKKEYADTDVEITTTVLKAIRNSNPEWGISYSIHLGVEALLELDRDSEACLFVVSDQPYLQEKSIVDFIEKYDQETHPIGICGHGNRMGNPVIFSQEFYSELSGMEGDKGGKQVVMRHLEQTFIYQIPEQELEDIDVRNP